MKEKSKWGFKRIVAVICIALLVLMYVLLLVFSLLPNANWKRMFIACMALTIAMPIYIWINYWLYDRIISSKRKKEDASIGKN